MTDTEAARVLIAAGYDPHTVVDAIATGDIARLKHTGRWDIQLDPPEGD